MFKIGTLSRSNVNPARSAPEGLGVYIVEAHHAIRQLASEVTQACLTGEVRGLGQHPSFKTTAIAP